jgi:hypothetical protein
MGVIRRTNPSGKEIWGIILTDEAGKRVRRFDRTWTKAQAQKATDDVEQKLRMGVDTHATMTVEELFHEWMENHDRVNCSPAHYEDSSTQFRLRIEPMVGHRRVDTVNKRLVRKMITEMQRVMREKDPGNEYAGHRTINKTLTVLKGMFSYAVEIDQIAANPIHGIPALPEKPTRPIEAWPLPVISVVADAALGLSDALDENHRNLQAASLRPLHSRLSWRHRPARGCDVVGDGRLGSGFPI